MGVRAVFGNPVHKSCGWLVSCLIGAYENDLQVPSIASITDPVLIGASQNILLAADSKYGLYSRVKMVVKGDDVLKPTTLRKIFMVGSH